MELKAERVVFTPDPALWTEFTESPTGTVGSDLRQRGKKLAFLAAQSVPKHYGHLSQSIGSMFYAGHNPYVLVGSSLDYAYFVHEGTKPHIITPNSGRMLRFKIQGKVVYARAVRHPGTKPTYFLTRHLRKVM